MGKYRKILIIGNFGLGALEHQYVFHLRNLGWSVHCFELQAPVQTLKNKNIINKIQFKITPNLFYSGVNQELLSFAREVQPLVILVFKGMEIYPETLKELKTCTKLLCNYNPDHPFNFYSTGSGNNNVEESITHYDLYGTYAVKIGEELKSIYKVNSFVIPFGYDANIKPTKTSPSITTFGFIGAFDKERRKTLTQLRNFPIEIYGDQKWATAINKNLIGKLKINGESLFNEDYASYCNSCLGVFNFLRPHNLKENSHNMRTFEVPGYGGVMITNRTDEQLAFFEEDKEAIYFSELAELEEKLTYLLTNPSQITRIKKNALKRAQRSSYSYFDRIKMLDSILNENL